MIALLVLVAIVTTTIVVIREQHARIASEAAARKLIQSELRRHALRSRAIDHAMFTRETIDAALEEIQRVARQQRRRR